MSAILLIWGLERPTHLQTSTTGAVSTLKLTDFGQNYPHPLNWKKMYIKFSMVPAFLIFYIPLN